MLAKTVKWGNGLALRIPEPLAREWGIEENTPVDILGKLLHKGVLHGKLGQRPIIP
jgi:antitoxin component of MazEF toxin-antitoxin module